MLFHVTAKHSMNDCNLYNPEVREAIKDFLPTLPTLCEELGVKIHSVVSGEPEHIYYFLVETDNYASLCILLRAVPLKQEVEIKPVRNIGLNN